jgi:hypothetical protein
MHASTNTTSFPATAPVPVTLSPGVAVAATSRPAQAPSHSPVLLSRPAIPVGRPHLYPPTQEDGRRAAIRYADKHGLRLAPAAEQVRTGYPAGVLARTTKAAAAAFSDGVQHVASLGSWLLQSMTTVDAALQFGPPAAAAARTESCGAGGDCEDKRRSHASVAEFNAKALGSFNIEHGKTGSGDKTLRGKVVVLFYFDSHGSQHSNPGADLAAVTQLRQTHERPGDRLLVEYSPGVLSSEHVKGRYPCGDTRSIPGENCFGIIDEDMMQQRGRLQKEYMIALFDALDIYKDFLPDLDMTVVDMKNVQLEILKKVFIDAHQALINLQSETFRPVDAPRVAEAAMRAEEAGRTLISFQQSQISLVAGGMLKNIASHQKASPDGTTWVVIRQVFAAHLHAQLLERYDTLVLTPRPAGVKLAPVSARY